jgi:1-acyl-sn-glycerol-3-phosphate acyltransferase
MMLKQLFFLLLVKPIILFISGVHLQGRENLPDSEPSILIANHNSHLDTLVIMSLFPVSKVESIRPVAAYDYFMKSKYMAWFSTNLLGIIPLKREVTKEGEHPFAALYSALEKGETLLLFPEGSRGKPEELQSFKTGIGHLAKAYPNVKVIPIYLHRAGKSLPKGEALFVPLVIDAIVGEPLYLEESTPKEFTTRVEKAIGDLSTNIRS